MRFGALSVALLALGASITSSFADPASAAGSDDGRPGHPGHGVVRTEDGRLRGAVSPDHVTFSGVPYAAPPVGERRWEPPAPSEPWRGIRDATVPASRCAQLTSDDDGSSTVAGSEDCLYLNVTVPRETRGARLGGARPVVVWVYGGNFVSGSGDEYDPARLAAEGDIVVVTVNYRLGALGFLSSPALDATGHPSGNYGLEDQAAALRWVQSNIAAFDGDPRNVTLAGQSAGSRAVCAQLAAPASQGLFHKVILQSGGCANEAKSKALADEHGVQATAEAGCSAAAAVAQCLRATPVADLLATLPGVGSRVTDRAANDPWGPVVGTPFLPVQPGDAVAAGSAAGLPMLVGTNRDEMSPMVGFEYDARGNPLTAEVYEALIVGAFGEDAAAVLAEYPASAHPSPALALTAVLGDWGGTVGACPALRTAQAATRFAPVFAYEFSEDSGLVYNGFPLGSFHGWELPYLFELSIEGSGYPDLTAEQERLGRDLRAYWAAFARTGNPNGWGRPWWPQFLSSRGTVVGISTQAVAPTPFAANHDCDFWAAR
jgi:para-nitrobenzyl esterase